MASNNDLLMDEVNASYFAPKLWLYGMIWWLPRTSDNSTHFAQTLEIRGIESRLYFWSGGRNIVHYSPIITLKNVPCYK